MMGKAIGIFDSGFGGLTVLDQIFKELPMEDTIYFGDTAHLPYGTKSRESVIRFSLKITDFLIKQGVKIIIVACNTASSFSIDVLREKTDLPIIGVIKPGARSAVSATRKKKVGVIGTEGTIRSRSYEMEIEKLNPDIKIFGQPCPLFVPLVEEGWLDKQVTLLVAKEYLSPLKEKDIDTLILGCTHYPLLKKIITRVMGLAVTLIDSAEETAKESKRVLEENNLMRKEEEGEVTRRYFVSDDPQKFVRLGKKFLGRDIDNIQKIDIT